jgi:indole-3-glycerol phosphate synthase
MHRKAAAIKKEPRFFMDAMQRQSADPIRIIAEIKRASPSKGNIRVDLDPAQFAVAYEKGGASAISVLTDQKFFKGSIADFQTARKACNLPMLRKDFLISEYQILESALLGADAVLLIARILSPAQLKELLHQSHELGMDALVEIHSEADLKSANEAGARLVGINNRNLKSFDTDIQTAITLFSLLEDNQIAVAASGIQSIEDICKNKTAGIYHFLIGECLVRSQNPVQLLQTFIHKQ